MPKSRVSGIVAIEVPFDPHTANVAKGDAQGIASNDDVASPTTVDAMLQGSVL